MNPTEVWPQIDPYRRRLIEALTKLSEADWQQPSLCTGWTVEEALAHLTYQHISIGTGLAGTVRARGNTDRMIHDVAVRRAAKLSTAELVELLRGRVGSRRHPPGVSRPAVPVRDGRRRAKAGADAGQPATSVKSASATMTRN